MNLSIIINLMKINKNRQKKFINLKLFKKMISFMKMNQVVSHIKKVSYVANNQLISRNKIF